MTDQVTISNEILSAIPLTYKSTYVLWTQGFDMRLELSRNTYYKHRRFLLDQYGIDIRFVPDKKEIQEVVQREKLPTIHELEPIKIPDWAFDMGLVHESTLRSDFA